MTRDLDVDASRISPEALLAELDGVRRLARRLLRDAHEADDVAQDALAAAIERPPRSAAGLRAWFARVTRNFARQTIRRADRRAARERDAARAELVDGPERIAEREAARAALVKALLALPEPARATLVLHYYEGLSARAIAARLGLPLETVRTRIRRGLARLRAELAEREEFAERGWMRGLALVALRPRQVAAASPLALAGVGGALAIGAVASVLALAASDSRESATTALAAPQPAERSTDVGAVAEPERTARTAPREPDALAPASVAGASDRGRPASREEQPGAVDLLARVVRPDHAALRIDGSLVLRSGTGEVRAMELADASEVRFEALPPDVYTVRFLGKRCEHYEQRFDLRGEGAESGTSGRPQFEERVIVWPEAWVALVVRTPDGSSFESIADALGFERKRVLVGAFRAFARLDPPDAANASDAPSARFREPPSYQSWALPGAVVGSLELTESPPMWVRLDVLGKPLEWKLLAPGARELDFTLDAERFARGFATLALRVVDAPGGAPVRGALATLKADTSAHRRADQAKVPPDADGRWLFTSVIPGRYELSVESAGALFQERIELAPGEARDLGERVLAPGRGVPLRVVDAEGKPARAWIEIAPYQRGARTSDLYPPNLHRSTGGDGEYVLPMPSAPSIVRATLMDPRTGIPSDDRSPELLLDPERPPLSEIVLVLREPIPVRFEAPSGARIDVLDALELVVASASGEKRASCEIVPGAYRARAFDASGTALGEARFELVDRPLTVTLP